MMRDLTGDNNGLVEESIARHVWLDAIELAYDRYGGIRNVKAGQNVARELGWLDEQRLR